MTLFHINCIILHARVDWGVNSKGVAGSEEHWDVLFVENICDFLGDKNWFISTVTQAKPHSACSTARSAQICTQEKPNSRFTTGQDPTVHVHQKHEGHSFSDASVHIIVMVS